ncbi:MAG: hypothetical protein K1X72_28310 [Pyrinomonadaceae bacterium]|nr:hypothetical protein [Pyrinomonadaceae bacterium]
MSNNINEIKNRINQLPLQNEVPIWKKVNSFAIGGLTQVGYAPNSDILLVVSHQGRGIFDCLIGEKIARDYDSETDQTWEQTVKLEGDGFNVLDGKK